MPSRTAVPHGVFRFFIDLHRYVRDVKLNCESIAVTEFRIRFYRREVLQTSQATPSPTPPLPLLPPRPELPSPASLTAFTCCYTPARTEQQISNDYSMANGRHVTVPLLTHNAQNPLVSRAAPHSHTYRLFCATRPRRSDERRRHTTMSSICSFIHKSCSLLCHAPESAHNPRPVRAPSSPPPSLDRSGGGRRPRR